MMGHPIESYKDLGDTLGTQEEVNRYNDNGVEPLAPFEEALLRLKSVELVLKQGDFDLHDVEGRIEAFTASERLFSYAVSGSKDLQA